MNKKVFAIFVLLFLAATFSINFVKGQEALYCAEKTLDGAWCQNVPLSEVNTDYRYDRTSCESTVYCSEGTCVDTASGGCLPGPQATCNSELGGFFYAQPKEEVSQCKIGCCLLGDGASLTERSHCDVLGKDYNVKATFREDITDEVSCLSLASPKAKGACVYETEQGRDCDFITRESCTTAGGDFHEGFLCTAPQLGTICAKTKRTTCVPGKNEVYFVDSCGNLANIYDANKIDDVAYWSYIPGVQGVEIDYGDGEGNIGSSIYGACDYLQGSTCNIGNAKFGNNICSDLRCPAGTPRSGGVLREHGEEWCSQPISGFEDAKPGELSYLLYCYNGKIHYELCDNFRNEICLEDREAGSANCVANRWIDCTLQNNTKDCLDKGARDCKVVGGASVAFLRTQYGTEKEITDSDTGNSIKAACVPKYQPGFKFWDSEGTILDTEEETPLSICEFASVTCQVPYTQEVVVISKFRPEPDQGCIDTCKSVEGWSNAKCYDACTPRCLEDIPGDDRNADANIKADWASSYQNLCVSLGDCGVKSNYQGKESYNRWRDLFKGEQINWNSLVNGSNKK